MFCGWMTRTSWWGNNQNRPATDLICTPNLCQMFISPDFGIKWVHWNADWHDCFHPWNGWVEKFVATTHTWQKPPANNRWHIEYCMPVFWCAFPKMHVGSTWSTRTWWIQGHTLKCLIAVVWIVENPSVELRRSNVNIGICEAPPFFCQCHLGAALRYPKKC